MPPGIIVAMAIDNGLNLTSDPSAICSILDAIVAAEPVIGTTLGTLVNVLADDAESTPHPTAHPTAWCAHLDLEGPAASRPVAARSGDRTHVVVFGEWPASALPALAAALRELPQLRGIVGEPPVVERLDELIGRSGVRVDERLFRLDELTPPQVPGSAQRAGATERELLIAWYEAFGVDAGLPGFDAAALSDLMLRTGSVWIWRDEGGRPVSMAGRRPLTHGSARIGPVYTPDAARGHGYGSAVTAAATTEILQQGAIPVLFTDLANPTSNAIYQRLGYRPVASRLNLTY
ncbi:FR47-like protein [Frankineae bacterium MT45]|nr:FR47-like protein [Frankineae bacterium MT45]